MSNAIEPIVTPKPAPSATEYTCPMHPDVVSSAPARCPKCNMQLVPKNQAGAKSGGCCDTHESKPRTA